MKCLKNIFSFILLAGFTCSNVLLASKRPNKRKTLDNSVSQERSKCVKQKLPAAFNIFDQKILVKALAEQDIDVLYTIVSDEKAVVMHCDIFRSELKKVVQNDQQLVMHFLLHNKHTRSYMGIPSVMKNLIGLTFEKDSDGSIAILKMLLQHASLRPPIFSESEINDLFIQIVYQEKTYKHACAFLDNISIVDTISRRVLEEAIVTLEFMHFGMSDQGKNLDYINLIASLKQEVKRRKKLIEVE